MPQKEIVWYQKPALVEREDQMRVDPPGWEHKDRPFPGGGKKRGSKLPLWGIVWYTWDPGDEDNLALLVASPVRKGYNYVLWKAALTSRIIARGGNPSSEIVETLTHVTFSGEAVIDLASMLDVVALGHWPPKSHIDAIKARSRVSTRVVLWGDHESISQTQAWSAPKEYIRSWQRAQAIFLEGINGCGSGVNGYGCTAIDKYETDNQTGGPCGATYPAGYVACPHPQQHNGLPAVATEGSHTWDIDIDDLAFVDGGEFLDGYIKQYYDVLDSYYLNASNVYVVDGFAFDNVLVSPYKGTAYNDYAAAWDGTTYTDAWKQFMNRFHNQAVDWEGIEPPPSGDWESTEDLMWGNATHAIDVYSRVHLQNRYVEHFFREGAAAKTLAQVQSDLEEIKTYSVAAVLGVNPGSQDIGNTYYWATTNGGPTPSVHGTWQEIYDYIVNLGIEDQVFAPAVQTFTDAYIFHQNGWREPV